MSDKSGEKYVLKGPQDGFVEAYQTLPERLISRLKYFKKRVIQVYPDESHSSTAEWILERASIEAVELVTHVRPGSNAVIFCPNTPHFAPVVLALLSLGAVCVPLSCTLPAEDLFPILGNVNPCVLVCLQPHADMVRKVYDRCPVVVMGKEDKKTQRELRHIEVRDFAKQPAFLLFTSGNSGITKKVTLTHGNIDVTLNSYRRVDSDLHETDVLVSSSPTHWYVGFIFQLISMDLGCKIVVPCSFSKDGLYHLVSLYSATVIFLVAQQYFIICKTQEQEASMLSTLKMALMAGMPVNARAQSFIETYLGVPTVQWYGATEIQSATTSYFSSKSRPPMGSIGKLKCWVEAKVVNVKGSPLKANYEGELCLRGPYMSSDVTTEWFHTGDLAYYDEEGYFYLLDPIKDLILFKNIRVLPSELELALLEHNCVMEAAVVGVPRAAEGEVPAAVVVLRHSTTVKDLQNYIEDVFPDRNKHLRGGLYVVRFIPKTASGKKKRKEIRDLCLKFIKDASRAKPHRDVSDHFKD